MALAKSWAKEAAEQIRSEVLRFFHEDPNLSALVPMLVRNVHVERIEKIIVEHADIIYIIEVPRCDACKQFEAFPNSDEGYCDSLSTYVKQNFGCVKWEKK
jgi:hypothetical protein